MKLRTTFTNSSAILVCCLLLSLSFFVACKKNKKEDATPPVETIKLSIDSTKAFPGQAVIIKASKRITTTETNIAVGSTIVKGYASGDSSYVFIVPVIASGTFSLSIPAIANSTTVNLTIPVYTAISNPQSVINEYVDKRNKSIDSVTKVVEGSNFQPSPQSIVLLNQVKEEWNVQINNLAADEKELLAYVLQRNMPDPSQYSFEAMPAGHFAKPGGIQSDVGDALVAIAKQYITAHTICLGSIPFLVGSGYAFIAAPNPVSALVFLGVFTTFVISREVAIRRAQEVGRLKGVAEEITDTYAQRVAEFSDNTEKTLNMSVGYRNLSSADASIQSDIAAAYSGEQAFSAKDKEVEAMYAKATAKTTKLKGAYPSYAGTIGKQAKATITLPIEGTQIMVKGVSDSRISYSSTVTGATRKVKINSAAKEEINFNLKVAYKRTLDGKEFTKDIACTFKPEIDSTAIYTAASVGWWTVTGYDPNNPTTTYTLELFANGSGKYHVPGNPNTYSTSWNIQRTASGYYLYESGFWHPAYNSLARTRLTYPLTSFKTFGNFDPNFVSQVYSKN